MSTRKTASDEQVTAAESFRDPYDAMSDEEFDAYVERFFGEPKGPTRSITLRMSEDLVTRLQRIAKARHIPYQRVMRRMLEEAVSALERRSGARRG